MRTLPTLKTKRTLRTEKPKITHFKSHFEIVYQILYAYHQPSLFCRLSILRTSIIAKSLAKFDKLISTHYHLTLIVKIIGVKNLRIFGNSATYFKRLKLFKLRAGRHEAPIGSSDRALTVPHSCTFHTRGPDWEFWPSLTDFSRRSNDRESWWGVPIGHCTFDTRVTDEELLVTFSSHYR